MKIFAASGSCMAETKRIKGKATGTTFTSAEFTGTMNSQLFWDRLTQYAKEQREKFSGTLRYVGKYSAHKGMVGFIEGRTGITERGITQ